MIEVCEAFVSAIRSMTRARSARKARAKSMRFNKSRQEGGALTSGTTFVDLQGALQVGEENMLTDASDALAKVCCKGAFIGSAFFYSREGHMLTARHVIWDSQNNRPKTGISIQIVSGASLPVQVITEDAMIDIAVLKASYICDKFLRAIHVTMGSTGYVMGFSPKSTRVSKGLISITNFPDVEAYVAAHADKGYSGGPVLDHNGKVRGVVLSGAGEQVLTTRFMPCSFIVDWLRRQQFGLAYLPNLVGT